MSIEIRCDECSNFISEECYCESCYNLLIKETDDLNGEIYELKHQLKEKS